MCAISGRYRLVDKPIYDWNYCVKWLESLQWELEAVSSLFNFESFRSVFLITIRLIVLQLLCACMSSVQGYLRKKLGCPIQSYAIRINFHKNMIFHF